MLSLHPTLWRTLLLAASLSMANCAHQSAQSPPLDQGVYVARGVCFGEGLCYRHWRAVAPVNLRERPDPASPIVAAITPEEWVEAVDGQLRLVPLRGVVHTATASPPLAVGDIVYMLEPEGEGYYILWANGRSLPHDWAAGDANEPITWDDARPAPPGAVLGWWVQLRRQNGQTGWVAEPSSFECMGSLQGSTDCRD